MKESVLVLGGGPDREREISVQSAEAVAGALRESYDVTLEIIDTPDGAELGAMRGEVIFPVLHGPWGEGGPLQDLLEADGRPYVGCGPKAARMGMDKLATKLLAARLGVPTAPAAIAVPGARSTPIPAPLVIKPTHEGSSVGLMVCRSETSVTEALAGIDRDRVWLVESLVAGREITVGMLGGDESDQGNLHALPLVEITPASGVYDYEAKYKRGDTLYALNPDIPASFASQVASDALTVANAMGIRHMARVDFILPPNGEPILLEVNTCPGFTATSLLPKAAARAGLTLPEVCGRLVRLAATDRAKTGGA